MDKPVKKYDEIWSQRVEVGHMVILHKPENDQITGTFTSPVVSYDETTGRIETKNTVYVPA